MSEQEQAQTRQDIEARIIAKAWKDEAYKQELLTNPQAVLAKEFGVEFPQETKVQVLEENSSSLYFVLPMSPTTVAQDLSEEQLEAIAGGYLVELGESVVNVSRQLTPQYPKLFGTFLGGVTTTSGFGATYRIGSKFRKGPK